MRLKRNVMCGAVRASHVDQSVVVSGWVDGIREMGGLVFIDLRDREGVVQLVFDKEDVADLHEQAKRLGREHVISAQGKVRSRGEKQINKDMPTGEVEVYIADMEVLAQSETPPIEIRDDIDADAELRLKYRYLDLRRPKMQEIFRLRHKVSKAARDYLDGQGFLEIETPYMTKPTPEGARDFLVPSRHHAGHFYALPQSPQIFKQILMTAGFDKYFQLARCFRDEDKRADRQPEHTQIDLEMSFVEPADVQKVVEGVAAAIIKAGTGVDIKLPLEHMTYAESLREYGIDRPDKRFGMPLVDLSEDLAASGFGVFKGAVEAGGVVKALCVPGGHEKVSKGQFKNLEKDAKGRGAKGLAFIRYTADGIDSPIAKFLSEDEQAVIAKKTGASAGDLVLFVADSAHLANQILGAFRQRFGNELGLVEQGRFECLWIDEFPQFEYDEEKNVIVPEHHPFVMPQNPDALFALAEELKRNDRKVTPKIVDIAKSIMTTQYDLVCNGVELGSGSVRITDLAVQDAMFTCIGMSQEEADAKFGFLLETMKYGAPPMAGIGMGLERWIMVLTGIENIQDVVVFPKTASAKGLMDGCPSLADAEQLKELHVNVNL